MISLILDSIICCRKKVLDITLFISLSKNILKRNKWSITTVDTMFKSNLLNNKTFVWSFIYLFFALFTSQATAALALNPIQKENALQGNTDWDSVNWSYNGEIEGYPSETSVNVKGKIKFYVNSVTDSSYTLTIYRLGWYNGAGARQMTAPVVRNSIKQVVPTPDPATGLIEANWTDPYTLTIPSNWVSGVYIARVVGDQSSYSSFIPFVIRNDSSYTKYLFQAAVTTWQAYNSWGGKSFYVGGVDGFKSRKVSFNRPYIDNSGFGLFLNWEMGMMRFLEREGYDVSYQTDIDTHNDLWSLSRHKALLSVGHDEYWTKNMRDNVELARDYGLSLGFFGANAVYWQARLEPSSTKQVNRTLVCYKYGALEEDPYALDSNTKNDQYITTLWRNAPLNRPENSLVGIMYLLDPAYGDIVVSNSSHWAYAGTGLKDGDKLPGMLGYEIDTYVDNGASPSTLKILAHSPINDPNNPGVHGDMSIYTKKCFGFFCLNDVATVFATGSMYWNYGLDSYGHDPALENESVKQITRNVLNRMAQ